MTFQPFIPTIRNKKQNDMKRNFRILTIATFLAIAPLMIFAQTPPHPNGGAAPGGGNTVVGGPSAPIESGAFILLALAVAYGARKFYEQRKHSAEETK